MDEDDILDLMVMAVAVCVVVLVYLLAIGGVI